MTQVEPKQAQAISYAVMHLIASTPQPRNCIIPILTTVQDKLGAAGAGLLIFDEPHLLKVVNLDESDLPDDLETIAADVAGGFHTKVIQGSSWVLSGVTVRDQVVGLMWLTFPEATQLTDEHNMILNTLRDGLIIVTRDIKFATRQEKLGRNHSEFMRIVSHDLRSPLTSMQGFASMLESGMIGEMNEKQQRFTEKILAGILQMTSLVDNFQDAGRFDPETGFYEMERTQCDLADMVQVNINNHLLPAEKQELSLNAVIADDIPIIYADINMLERAITNLVDNAIKYTPNGRSIEVRVAREDEQIIISVKDDGLGISEENQRLLFERHVRIPRREHKRVKGSGLGLFIVRSVARQHGGDAWVESEEGVGSTFYISIPLNEANTTPPAMT